MRMYLWLLPHVEAKCVMIAALGQERVSKPCYLCEVVYYYMKVDRDKFKMDVLNP